MCTEKGKIQNTILRKLFKSYKPFLTAAVTCVKGDITYIINYLLTPCSTVLFEKLSGSQLVKQFPAFYGTRRFITAFISGGYLSLS
jgi:hypothetical protein